VSGKMKARCLLLGCVVMLTGCSQALDYTYSKRNFTSLTFQADLSACKHQCPSISAFQTPSQEQRAQLDDAAVQDCMITKGYKIETEGR
jgi:hypothetical protein